MSDERPLLLGGGALARVLVDLAGPEHFAGAFVEPGHPAAALAGLPVLRSWPEAAGRARTFVLAVGDVALRRRLLAAALAAGLRPAVPIVSPLAVVARDAELGPGCVLGPQAVLAPAVRLHAHVLLMPAVVLGHDVCIDENCVLAAGTVMGGGSALGADCFVGLNATLVPRIRLAAGSVVGAGAVCLDSVAVPSLLVGNPARAVPRSGPGGGAA